MSIGGLIASIGRQAADPAVERAVAVQVADALACLALAAPMDEARQLADFYHADRSAGVASRAASAAAIIRMSEGDAIHIPSCLTPAAIVVPVALLAARDGEDLMRAMRAGTSIGLWIAQSVGGVRALENGVWPTLLAAPAMAASAAAVAKGLEAEQVAHAVALALSGSSGRLGRPSGTPSARWIAFGEAVARGVRAADAAHRGFQADATIPDAQWFRAQNAGEPVPGAPDPDAILQAGLKPFFAARQGMNALAAFDAIRAQFDPAAIESIDIELREECLPVVTRPVAAGERLSRLANLAFRIAASALDRDALLDPSGAPEDLAATLALAERVAVRAGDFDPGETGWPARIRVTARGSVHEGLCLRQPGEAGDFAGQARIVSEKIAGLEGSVRDTLEHLADARDAGTILRQGRKMLDRLTYPNAASTRQTDREDHLARIV